MRSAAVTRVWFWTGVEGWGLLSGNIVYVAILGSVHGQLASRDLDLHRKYDLLETTCGTISLYQPVYSLVHGKDKHGHCSGVSVCEPTSWLCGRLPLNHSIKCQLVSGIKFGSCYLNLVLEALSPGALRRGYPCVGIAIVCTALGQWYMSYPGLAVVRNFHVNGGSYHIVWP